MLYPLTLPKPHYRGIYLYIQSESKALDQIPHFRGDLSNLYNRTEDCFARQKAQEKTLVAGTQ